MSSRLFARRWAKGTVATGADEPIVGVNIPSDGIVNNVNFNVSIFSKDFLDYNQVIAYAVEGYIIPVIDPDTVSNMGALWDRFVPKDTDVTTMDLDTGAADVTPFFEPGEGDWTALMDVGVRPEKIFSRSRLLTVANGGSIMSVQDNQTPFAPQWIPGDSFKIKLSKRYRVQMPSIMVFAVASPSFDDTTATVLATLSENEWPRVKYIGEVLKQGLMDVLGLIESGAETPWEEASALLQKFLEPNPFESSAGDFASSTLHFAADGHFDLSVAGELETAVLTTGR